VFNWWGPDWGGWCYTFKTSEGVSRTNRYKKIISGTKDSRNCKCDEGWTGQDCRTAVCKPECENGKCVAGNNCICDEGWTGNDCNTAVCKPECQNGKCVAGNCICDEGWTGKDCKTKITGPNSCTDKEWCNSNSDCKAVKVMVDCPKLCGTGCAAATCKNDNLHDDPDGWCRGMAYNGECEYYVKSGKKSPYDQYHLMNANVDEIRLKCRKACGLCTAGPCKNAAPGDMCERMLPLIPCYGNTHSAQSRKHCAKTCRIC